MTSGTVSLRTLPITESFTPTLTLLYVSLGLRKNGVFHHGLRVGDQMVQGLHRLGCGRREGVDAAGVALGLELGSGSEFLPCSVEDTGDVH